jgi:hypothetical protein
MLQVIQGPKLGFTQANTREFSPQNILNVAAGDQAVLVLFLFLDPQADWHMFGLFFAEPSIYASISLCVRVPACSARTV